MGQGNAARRKDFLLEGGHCAIIGIFFSAANTGYEDLDAAFMALLIDCNLSLDKAHGVFQTVFGSDYDGRRTDTMYARTRQKIEAGDPIIGAGSFVQKVKEHPDLKIIARFVRELETLCKAENRDSRDAGGEIPSETPAGNGTPPQGPDVPSPRPIDPMECLKTGAQIQAMEISVEWLVPGILPARSLTTFTGRAGIGKTMSLLDMADAMSKGNIFLDRQTVKIPICYTDFENPLPVVVDRARKLNITAVYFWLQGSEFPPPRIDSGDYQAYKRLPPGLLIFESLRASQAGDENSSKDMAFVMQRYKELRDCGHTVILIHHTMKANEQSFRGSMAILDLADHVLSFFPVRKPGSDTPIEGDDLDAMTFYLGTKEKTRFSPVKLYVCRAGGRFEVARHPDDQKIEAMAEVLSGQELTKTDFFKAVKKECNFGKDLAGRLLKIGEARGIWECFSKEKKNGYRFRLCEVGGLGYPPKGNTVHLT
jgi:hypothetical protein